MNIFATQFSFQNMSFEIYISGCKAHPCKGCFNYETWSEDVGDLLDNNHFNKLENQINKKIHMIENIWVLGGEPLEKSEEELIELFNFLKRFNKPLWLFTRFQLNEISPVIKSYFTYIKTGQYDMNKKDKKIRYNINLGSHNQEIYYKYKNEWVTEKQLYNRKLVEIKT